MHAIRSFKGIAWQNVDDLLNLLIFVALRGFFVPYLSLKSFFVSKTNKKHVDGAGKVDGSCVVALPTDVPFQGGGLTFWDGRPIQEMHYDTRSGDLAFIDRYVVVVAVIILQL